jgi:hypothetical protein
MNENKIYKTISRSPPLAGEDLEESFPARYIKQPGGILISKLMK